MVIEPLDQARSFHELIRIIKKKLSEESLSDRDKRIARIVYETICQKSDCYVACRSKDLESERRYNSIFEIKAMHLGVLGFDSFSKCPCSCFQEAT